MGPVLDLSGAVLEGAYRLVRLIGQGGMGVVYEAVQLRLNKRVAVKIMSREHACNTVSLARFHREAEITSRLGHPHLVNVMDFGTSASGEPYLVMEILDGEDLEVRLQKVGRMPLEAAVRITRQAASALGAAHAQGVVHRDMKPANIFLLHVPDEQEFVKVLDFGISKMKAARTRLTRASAVIGTPIYMSPEQTMGRVDDTDHRADQWALACIAWEMLSGSPPFQGDDVATLFHQINRVDPPPLETSGSDLVPGVELVLRKALSKGANERYPSIREFGHALETTALGRWAEVTPPIQSAPQLELVEASSGHGAVGDAARPVGPFADTGLVARARPMWRRPGVAVAGAAGLVLLGAAVLLLRASSAAPVAGTSSTSALPLSALAEVAAHPPTVSAVAPTFGPPIPATTGANPPASIKSAKVRGKVTPARAPGMTAKAESPSKHKAPKAQRRPKIIKEL